MDFLKKIADTTFDDETLSRLPRWQQKWFQKLGREEPSASLDLLAVLEKNPDLRAFVRSIW